MGWEIERRFLVRAAEALESSLGTGRHLRQGYVRNGETTVRIRFGEGRGPVLSCKSGQGIRRSEVETVVPGEVAEALLRAAEDRVIEKIRWPLDGWVLDRFLGPLEGLELLEVELESEDQPLPPPPPGVQILREVTEDKRFVSAVLARMKPAEQRELVETAYEEVEGWKGLSG